MYVLSPLVFTSLSPTPSFTISSSNKPGLIKRIGSATSKLHLTKSPSNSHLLPEYNVLVLGETQSGKSTLIQYMRKYANPLVEINTKALGTGFLSHTQEVTVTDIVTDLPEYYVQEKKGVYNLNYGKFLEIPDEHDYEDALNIRKGLETKKGGVQLPRKVKFNLIDTPGLNTTGGDDEIHVQKIFDTLIQVKIIHLLLIIISSRPFTQGLQDAIRSYVDMFPDFNGIIAFVHTHFDYKDFHPARIQVSNAIEFRMERFHGIMGRTTVPHFKIDCDIYNKKPIRDCITKNIIQKILELATLNQPVNMLHTLVNKPRKMRVIDNILREKFEATSATIERTLCSEDKEEGELLVDIFRREIRIHKLEARIKALNEFLIRHDVTLLEILHEERRDDVNGQEGNFTIRYPQAGELGFTIKRRDLLCHNIKVLKEVGSEADKERWTSWQGVFQRTSPQNSVLHVKIYTTKSNLHSEEIKVKQLELNRLIVELEEARKFRDSHALQKESKKQQIKEIVNNHSEDIQILAFVANEVVAPKVFNALMLAEAYIGDTVVCAKKVEKVYIELTQ
ncbi:hypothetical protein BG005_009978 [Podila minutissima]|nr:hypothetical protein BG005_009978 [Podila minutissima]